MTYRLRFLLGALLAVCACAHPNASSSREPARPENAGAEVRATPALAEAMGRLDFLHGVWVGTAEGTGRDGSRYTVGQTERVGPMLGGDVLVIEGRGYAEDGSTAFNAFAVISFDPRTQKYEMRSHAQGRVATFELRLTEEGYSWEMPAGPEAVVRFTASVKDGRWHQVGEYLAAGQPPVRTFEMNLQRVGETDWPRGGALPPAALRQ